MATDDQNKALDTALTAIEKQFGKGSIMRLGENVHMQIDSIPTGALALDLALGIGGLPRGRIVEIYGPESSGKSTLATHVVAEAQRNGGICAYIDAEHAMDPVYAAAIGVNVDDLLISQPDTGEQALEIADMLIRSGALDVLVIDSVAALTPRAEIEGEMGDAHVGLQATADEPGAAQDHREPRRGRTPSRSSSTSSARRSASSTARRRSRPAAARSSSTPRSASTSGGSSRSKTASRSSGTARVPRS